MLGTNPGALAPATLRISTLSVSLPAIVEDHLLVMIKFQFFSKVIFLQSYTEPKMLTSVFMNVMSSLQVKVIVEELVL